MEQEGRKLPVVLAVLAISFGSYIHGTSIVFPDVRTIISSFGLSSDDNFTSTFENKID